MVTILGIETSCDETAAAVVNDSKNILSHVVLSQVEHKIYGGVVPEVAARAHVSHIEHVVKAALEQANITLNEIDAIAVTGGPGLIGGVIVGVMFAKALASSINKPLICVNHLEGHALTIRLVSNIEFPFLLLLVSGGHSQFLIAHDIGEYTKIGETLDDSIGESFDKLAKMMGLEYPGGPIIEKMALEGVPCHHLPKAMLGREGCDMSFSGLKTACRLLIEQLQPLSRQDICDISCSFQSVVAYILLDRISNAIKIMNATSNICTSMVIAGGVAANKFLNSNIENFLSTQNISLYAPPLQLCTDNSAMIAWAGIEKYRLGIFDPLSFEPKARWPLS